MTSWPVSVALECSDLLGEGPWWSVADQLLWRVDIQGKKLHRWSPSSGDQKTWNLDEPIGCFVPCADGQHGIAGLQSGIVLIDLETGEVKPIAEPEPQYPENRFNDGKCDRAGRFWAGTMDDSEAGDAIGSFYRLDNDGGVQLQLHSIITSNGMGWSPDNRTFYYTDSGVRTIWAFSFDPESGSISNQRAFVMDGDYAPDGLTVDAEGFVWSAKWGGSRIVRYDPDGKAERTIELPVSRPTSVMFGGAELERLYITSARWGLGDSEPLAGHVFECDTGVRGLPESPCLLDERVFRKAFQS